MNHLILLSLEIQYMKIMVLRWILPTMPFHSFSSTIESESKMEIRRKSIPN